MTIRINYCGWKGVYSKQIPESDPYYNVNDATITINTDQVVGDAPPHFSVMPVEVDGVVLQGGLTYRNTAALVVNPLEVAFQAMEGDTLQLTILPQFREPHAVRYIAPLNERFSSHILAIQDHIVGTSWKNKDTIRQFVNLNKVHQNKADYIGDSHEMAYLIDAMNNKNPGEYPCTVSTHDRAIVNGKTF